MGYPWGFSTDEAEDERATAEWARHHATIIRSMSTLEGAHDRARYHMLTGYRQGSGGLTYPSLGSIAAKEIGSSDNPLPNFVSIGTPGYSSGYLGAHYQPLNVQDPGRGARDGDGGRHEQGRQAEGHPGRVPHPRCSQAQSVSSRAARRGLRLDA